MAAAFFRGPRTKFLLWFICIHDFESHPSERELSYDFALTLVTLLYNLLCPSVGRSVSLVLLHDFISLTSLLLPKWSIDLKYGPCPPARDFGSRVCGLVELQAFFALRPFPNHPRLSCHVSGLVCFVLFCFYP